MSSMRSRQANEVVGFFGEAFVIGCILVALWLAAGCASLEPAKVGEPCSEADLTLAAIVAECRARVRAECFELPGDTCPTRVECWKRIDARCGQ